jgi:hypothetical protein
MAGDSVCDKENEEAIVDDLINFMRVSNQELPILIENVGVYNTTVKNVPEEELVQQNNNIFLENLDENKATKKKEKPDIMKLIKEATKLKKAEQNKAKQKFKK